MNETNDNYSDNNIKEKINQNGFSYDDMYSLINTLPALFWRIEIVKNRIEYLNDFKIPGLGENSRLLLKNTDFSREIIFKEDLFIFESFIQSILNRKPAFAIFRIKQDDGTKRWIKIAGHPDHHKSTYYMGYILEVNDVVHYLDGLSNNAPGVKGEIEIFDNPILIAKFSDKKIYASNEAALDVLGYSSDEMKKLTLKDIFRDHLKKYVNEIYEEILFYQRWNGKLSFYDSNSIKLHGEVAIRSLSQNGENLLWISLYDIRNNNPETATSWSGNEVGELLHSKISRSIHKIGRKEDITDILNLFLENQPINNLADSILYSDIHFDEEKVITYGVGSAFKDHQPGKKYSYEGTIAENIVKYDLDHIIIEDTYKSIKPIDWALFIPLGIKSYYAIPFFENGILKTVMTYCSQETSTFSEENTEHYKSQFSLIREALDRWSKAKK